MDQQTVPVTVAVTVVGGVACQLVARLLRMPAIVPLIFVGLAFGPDVLGLVRPEALGEGLRVMVGFAVGIILFEGGLSLKTEAFRLAGRAIRNLVILGSLITWWLTTLAARLLFPELDVGLAILFGSLVIVTGPTVILPLIHAIHPKKRVANALRGEAILIDPVGALYAVLVLELLLEAQQGGTGHVLGAFAARVGLGVAIGAGGAFLLYHVLRRQEALAPDLKNLTVLAGAIGLYALSEAVLPESGVLSVTLGGFLLGWFGPPGIEEIEEFKAHITMLMVSMVFILLAANLSLAELVALGWPGVGLLLVVVFVVRPLSVFACTLGSDFALREKLFLAWVAPRGIVAAAVSSLFAIILEDRGMEGGRQVMAMTFLVIVGTVVVMGPTAKPVGRLLKVLAERRTGFLIAGGNSVGRAFAKGLMGLGLRVLVVDTNTRRVRACREAGIPARRANVLDELVMDELDLDDIGNFLGLTPSDSVNRVGVRIWRRDFGSTHVRAVRLEDSPPWEEGSAYPPYLLGEAVTWSDLRSKLDAGWTVESADVDEPVSTAELHKLVEGAVPLLALTPARDVRFLSEAKELQVGETLLYLHAPEPPSASTP